MHSQKGETGIQRWNRMQTDACTQEGKSIGSGIKLALKAASCGNGEVSLWLTDLGLTEIVKAGLRLADVIGIAVDR